MPEISMLSLLAIQATESAAGSAVPFYAFVGGALIAIAAMVRAIWTSKQDDD